MAGFFFNDEMTPQAIDAKRELIRALSKDNLSAAPVGHWTAALARVLGAGADQYETAKLNEADVKGSKDWVAAFTKSLGGAASPPAPSAGAALPASQPAPATVQSPPQVQQQPLMPNRPQMPPMFENTAGPGAMAPDGTPMPPVRPANPGAPSPFGSVQMPVNPVPSQQAGSTPLWIQQGLTKALPQIGQQQINPTLAYNEPGPAAPMGASAAPAGNAASTFARMLTQESGNKQFRPDGSPVTSSAGAIGIAQVMPGTGPEAARLAGLPWDPNRFRNDANYNRTLGQAYYQAQVNKYGDPTTAAAAYNAGPGNVDKAIRQQQATGQPFTDFLPKETQGYIAAVGGPSGGAPVQTAHATQTDAPAPNAAQAQFNVPGAPAQSGSTPQAAALLQALSSPWAARNPMLAQLGQRVLGEQLTGNKLTYQTDGEGNIIALDPTGRRPPQVVYKAAVKPTMVQEGASAIVPDPNSPDGWKVIARGGDKETPDMKNYKAVVEQARAAGVQPPNYNTWLETMKKAGGTNVSLSTEKRGQELIASKGIEGMTTALTAATDAQKRIASYGQITKSMSGFTPGATAETRLQAKAVLKDLGIIKGTDVPDGEAMKAAQRRLELAATPRGQGQITENERTLIREQIPTIATSPEGVVKIISNLQRLDQYDIAVHKIYMESAKANAGIPNYLEVQQRIMDLGPPLPPEELQSLKEMTASGKPPTAQSAQPSAGPKRMKWTPEGGIQ